VQPWIDVPGLSWKAVVTTDGDHELAARAAERLMAESWAARHEFLAGRRRPVDAALEEALAGPAPVVLGDAGDATNGGAIGDSTELLRAVLRRGGASVLLSIRDAAAAATAARAGEGAELEVELGSGGPGAYNERTPWRARVERLFDGEVVYTHPVNAGYRASTGAAALLVGDGGLQVVVHTLSVGVIDPALYVALGADPSAAAVIQAKSHVSYKAGFEPITTRSVVAETGGPTTGDLQSLPYARRPRPLYPFEDS
jgi:microcystin degradation protein MlrC